MKTIKFKMITMMVCLLSLFNTAKAQNATVIINNKDTFKVPSARDTTNLCFSRIFAIEPIGCDSAYIQMDHGSSRYIKANQISIDTVSSNPLYNHASIYFYRNDSEVYYYFPTTFIYPTSRPVLTYTPPTCGSNVTVRISDKDSAGHNISDIWNVGSSHDSANTFYFPHDSIFVSAISTFKDGCIDTASSWVYRKQINATGLCWCTVDSSSKHNIIVWDSTGFSNQATDSVKLYYLNASSQWQKIGEEPFNTTDTGKYFVDMLNNPNANTVRYIITLKDSCGDEELFSNALWQNTMKIIPNGIGTFTWSGTGYEIQGYANAVRTYYLFKDTGTGYFEIDSISGTQNQMTDPNFSNTAHYYVGAELEIPLCPITPVAMGHHLESAMTLSRSNIVKGNATGISEMTDIFSCKVFPNPATSSISVIGAEDYNYTLSNVLGQSVLSGRIEKEGKIDLSSLTTGVYIIKIEKGNQTFIGKIIKI